MFVIIVNSNLATQRDSIIDSIISVNQKPDEFLVKTSSSKKYSRSTFIAHALIFKTKSGALRVVKKFNEDVNKSYWTNQFNWVKDYCLSVRKITPDEWQIIVDTELSKLERNYIRQKEKLQKKKSLYR